MAKGIKTGGRQKGTPNKLTRVAKDVIASVAEDLGGAERLAEWAKEAPENEKAFWVSIYPKLLPLQVTGDPENPLAITEVVRTVVDPKA